MKIIKILALLMSVFSLVCFLLSCSSDSENGETTEAAVTDNVTENDDGYAESADGTWTGLFDYTPMLLNGASYDGEIKPLGEIELNVENGKLEFILHGISESEGVKYFLELYENYYGCAISEEDAQECLADFNSAYPQTFSPSYTEFDGEKFVMADGNELSVEISDGKLTVLNYTNEYNLLYFLVGTVFEISN